METLRNILTWLMRVGVPAIMLASHAIQPAAAATLLDFEDRPVAISAMASGYGGFSWDALGPSSSDVYTMDWQANGYGGTGYQKGAVSGSRVAFASGSGGQPAVIDWLGVGGFDFLSADWTSAFVTQTLRFEGWMDGGMIYQSSDYVIGRDVPTHIALDWHNIDRLVIRNSRAGYQWVVDDFRFASAVPEPDAWLLLLAGAALMAMTRNGRRRYPA